MERSLPPTEPARPEPRLPPGPRLPRVVQTAGFMLAGPRFLDACRRRYGDAVFFRTLFDNGFVMIFHPALVKELFQGSGRAAPRRRGERHAGAGGGRTVGAAARRLRAPAPPPADASAVPRPADAHLRRGDAPLGRPGDRRLAGRRAVRAPAFDAVPDAAGDHGGGVRLRARLGRGGAPPAGAGDGRAAGPAAEHGAPRRAAAAGRPGGGGQRPVRVGPAGGRRTRLRRDRPPALAGRRRARGGGRRVLRAAPGRR